MAPSVTHCNSIHYAPDVIHRGKNLRRLRSKPSQPIEMVCGASCGAVCGASGARVGMSLISLCGGCAEVRAEVPPLIPPYVLRPLYRAGAGT
jgi:hypothetical protein